MKRIAALSAVLVVTACASAPTPYSGEQDRDIKALSAKDASDLLAGKGMGFAKAAELNGYPGPAHVLELSPKLGLSEKQRSDTQALFDAMQAKAASLGRELVDAERNLDRLFATKSASPESMGTALARIGELQAKVRGAHLEAHIAQARILTPEQTARYAELRGYGSGHAH